MNKWYVCIYALQKKARKLEIIILIYITYEKQEHKFNRITNTTKPIKHQILP